MRRYIQIYVYILPLSLQQTGLAYKIHSKVAFEQHGVLLYCPIYISHFLVLCTAGQILTRFDLNHITESHFYLI